MTVTGIRSSAGISSEEQACALANGYTDLYDQRYAVLRYTEDDGSVLYDVEPAKPTDYVGKYGVIYLTTPTP